MLQDTCTIAHDPLPDLLYTGSPCQLSLLAKVDSAFFRVRVCRLPYGASRNSASYSLSQGHGQGSSCFPGDPYRKIKAIIVTNFGSIIKLVRVSPCPSTFHSYMVTFTLRFRSSSLVCNDPDLGDRAWITCGPYSVDWYVVCIDHVFPLHEFPSSAFQFLVVILLCLMQGDYRAVPVWVHASPGSGVQVLSRKFVCHKEIELISRSGKTSGLHWLLGNLLRVYAVNPY
ncbi:hypothetical protein MTO96_019327 [Rhipicephalus appendiculatus]